MAELKPTPVKNEKLLALSKLLRKGKDLGNKVQIPEAVPLLGGQGLGDMFLGESPEEVENWAYGNSPVTVPEMSNIPQIRQQRKQGVIDSLGLVPFAGGGAGQAGTLPFKLRHTKKKLVDDWVTNGMIPYSDAQPKTPQLIEHLSKKADKLRSDTELFRLAHNQEEVQKLKALKPGDLYSPGRVISTTFDEDVLPEISDIFSNTDQIPLKIEAPKGTKIGGSLGQGNANYYNEFVVRPDAVFERVDTGPAGGFTLRALTESEANLRRRIEKLRSTPKRTPWYHGGADFDRFDPNTPRDLEDQGHGLWLTRDEENARGFAEYDWATGDKKEIPGVVHDFDIKGKMADSDTLKSVAEGIGDWKTKQPKARTRQEAIALEMRARGFDGTLLAGDEAVIYNPDALIRRGKK